MSIAVFWRIVLAVATAPKSHPARVNGTHGAGAILPFSLIISGVVSVVLPRRVKERRRPIGERDAGPGRAIGLKVAEAVRYRLPHTVRINTGERGQDAGGGVRDQHGVVVRHQYTVVLDEIEQVRHLLEIRGDVGAVPSEVRVVELDVDHMLDGAFRGFELAAICGGRRS